MTEANGTVNLSTDDKQLLSDAMAEVRRAEGIVDFVGRHLQRKYGLSPGDRINPDGSVEVQYATDRPKNGPADFPIYDQERTAKPL